MTDSKLAKQAALPRRSLYRKQRADNRLAAIVLSKRKPKAKRK